MPIPPVVLAACWLFCSVSHSDGNGALGHIAPWECFLHLCVPIVRRAWAVRCMPVPLAVLSARWFPLVRRAEVGPLIVCSAAGVLSAPCSSDCPSDISSHVGHCWPPYRVPTLPQHSLHKHCILSVTTPPSHCCMDRHRCMDRHHCMDRMVL